MFSLLLAVSLTAIGGNMGNTVDKILPSSTPRSEVRTLEITGLERLTNLKVKGDAIVVSVERAEKPFVKYQFVAEKDGPSEETARNIFRRSTVYFRDGVITPNIEGEGKNDIVTRVWVGVSNRTGFDAVLKSGMIALEGVDFSQLSIHGKAGQIEMNGVDVQNDVDIDLTYGNLEGQEANGLRSGRISMSAGNVDIRLKKSEIGRIVSDVGLGSVKYKIAGCERSDDEVICNRNGPLLSIKATAGSVRVKGE